MIQIPGSSWARGRSGPGWTSERSFWRWVAGSSGRSVLRVEEARLTGDARARSEGTLASGKTGTARRRRGDNDDTPLDMASNAAGTVEEHGPRLGSRNVPKVRPEC